MKNIQPINNNGSICLKFELNKKVYKFSPIKGAKFNNPSEFEAVQKIGQRIAIDISEGNFDPTLQKYRKKIEFIPNNFLEIWEAYTDFKARFEALDPETIKQKYLPIRSNLIRFGEIKDSETALSFMEYLRGRQSPRISNETLGRLKACCNWAIDEEILKENPFKKIKPLKIPDKLPPSPFTTQEISQLLATAVKHFPQNYDFIFFLLQTGVRIGEGIALQWKHVNLTTGEITICESMQRSGHRKPTKTGTIRILPITEPLREILVKKFEKQPTPDDLVFTAPMGGRIHYNNFRGRVFKKLFELTGIPYRSPGKTRHTCLSHAIDQGASLADAAKIAGHKSLRMVNQVYGRSVKAPTLPDLSAK